MKLYRYFSNHMKSYLTVILIYFSLSLKAQFGFEWIKPYQPYIKFKVWNKNAYQLDSSTLAQFPSFRGINSNKLQLFKNGVEQPLYVTGNSDNIFNQNDKLHFYAEPNDGNMDTELYTSAGEQSHTFNSLFNDTACYYLTILPDSSIIIPKRFLVQTDTNYSAYTPENILLARTIIAPQQEYYRGAFLPASEKYYLSDYAGAEGWSSYLVGLGQSAVFSASTPNALANGTANISIKVIGASDFLVSSTNIPNHHIRIYAGNTVNPSNLIVDTVYNGYGPRLFNRQVPQNIFGSTTYFKIEVVNDLGVGSDFNSLSYIDISYQRSSSVSTSSLTFGFNPGVVASIHRIDFSNYNFNNPAIFDLTLQQWLNVSENNGIYRALVNQTNLKREYFLYSKALVQNVTNLQPVNFNFTDITQNWEYIIISHPDLESSALQYAQYRSQRYKTLLAYTPDLYELYGYGYPSPLAVKRFLAHLMQVQANAPRFLLLLGRGYQNNLIKFDLQQYKNNLVPAIGEPSSDNLYTANALGVPQMATGRIPAVNNTEVLNYLNKLIQLETTSDSAAQWRKQILHLSGGSVLGEQLQFTGQVNTLKQWVQNRPVGANVSSYHKNSTAPTQTNLRQTLLNHLNNGVNLMTFLGHGSLTVLDMDFGGINDLLPNNRPAFYYFNGCNIGNANDIDPNGTGLVYGKDYITADKKGAIGWLAHSNLTLTGILYNQMNKFYEQLAFAGYGKPIGENISAALQNAVAPNDAYAKSHALQLLLQGDPAFVVYGPSLPDAKIASNDLFIYPANANAQMDSIAVGIILNNLGKASTDTLSVEVTRTLPAGNKAVRNTKIPMPLFADTFYVYFKVNPEEVGNNIFEVQVNGSQQVAEISYLNNLANFTLFLPGSGVQQILPFAFEWQSSDSVNLVVQNNNLLAENSVFELMLDTTPAFNSPFLKTNTINNKTTASWPLVLPLNNTYYWRVALVQPNQPLQWQTRSFTLGSLPEHNGFSKLQYHEHKQAVTTNLLLFNDSLKQMQFADNEYILGIENRRWDHRRMGVVIPYLLNAGVGSCIAQGTVALVFNPLKADYPEELSNYPFNCTFVQNNKFDISVRYYTFNTNSTQGQDDLSAFIDSIPSGYYVAMFSRYSSNADQWSTDLRNKLSLIGSNKIGNITNPNTCWAIIGQKGSLPGSAAEDTLSNNELAGQVNLPPLPNEPQDELYLRIRKTILQKWFTGSFITQAVGPAKSWQKLSVLVEPKATGRWFYNIYGVKNNTDTLLLSNQTINELSLTSINANVYPYLKLEMVFVDSVARVPHQVKAIQFGFEKTGEITVAPQLANYYFYGSTLFRGDSLELHLPVQNLSRYTFDSSVAEIKITDENRITRIQQQQPLNVFAGGEVKLLKFKLPTISLGSTNQLSVLVNSTQKPEITNNNNFYVSSFTIDSDTRTPLLDVTFDGAKIMSGDIVSPNPVIKITSTDNDRFLMQSDTSTFKLFIRTPDNFNFTSIHHNQPDVVFEPATKATGNKAVLTYSPKNLSDGIYTLKVQATDASGNLAGSSDYEIDFNVINKSSITYFYPYPNPFTTQMRFVFTVTGSTPPTDLMVRIFTVSGKLVKEVSKQEFGPIRIGNNISEFAWDGTDQFGDKLANGVYLYQVLTRINGNTIEHRATRAKDEGAYFVNNTGKIYLMR